LGHYFSTYDVEKGIGLNSSDETIKQLSKFVETKWRDLFLLHYTPNSLNNGEKDIHWDFSGLSMVGCLTDDYEGGKLIFPRQNVTYRLEKGDIIVFPGGLTHPHYVEPVTKGLRDVIVGQSMTLSQDHKIDY
jgi:predicted 2-oxoglutarate/Fe(II)-dependent dioxygenase YbiX